jgi:hypothetical protein
MASRTSTNANLFYPMTSEITDIPDSAVAEEMEQHGGFFIRGLAEAFRRADPKNRAKIKAGWSEDWAHYQKMAEQRTETEVAK